LGRIAMKTKILFIDDEMDMRSFLAA